mmetsp:Transcript_58/g.119  ORF Transcript_58/g.119 Transcript_58/m.119 type:complete len:222 (+) Transcript_58:2714-3379(+)
MLTTTADARDGPFDDFPDTAVSSSRFTFGTVAVDARGFVSPPDTGCAAPALFGGKLLLAEHKEGTVPLSARSPLSVLTWILAGLRNVLYSNTLASALPPPRPFVVEGGGAEVDGATGLPGDGPRPRPRRETTPRLLLVLFDEAGETFASVGARGATTFSASSSFSAASLLFSVLMLLLLLLLLNRTVLFNDAFVLELEAEVFVWPSRGVTVLTVPSESGVV